MDKIKVLICDDDGLIRDGLKMILSMSETIDVIDTAVNGEEALKKVKLSPVDVVLMDIRMPVMNGVDATYHIRKETDAKILILTTFDEEEFITKGIKNGASGYMLKSSEPKEIIQALQIVYAGNSYMQGDIMDKLRNSVDQKKEKNLSEFTEREQQIIKLISQGLSNKEIASEAFISEGTVKNYISNILSKTGLKHRTQIAIWYLK